MKLRRIRVQNVRSFLEPAELHLDGNISIIIGPNGGGKTNLLDVVTTVIRKYLLTSWVPRLSATVENPQRQEFVLNETVTGMILDVHTLATNEPQIIEADVEVTKRDLENMERIKTSAEDLADRAKNNYVGASTAHASRWDLSRLREGQSLNYRILNGTVQETPDAPANIFREYLNLYEVDSQLRHDFDQEQLSMPLLSMPVNRVGAGLPQSVSLSDYDEYSSKRAVDSASSRTTGSIMSLAIGRLATKYRTLLEEDSGKARETFFEDSQIKSLTSILASMGYRWNLQCVNLKTNQYNIQLEKQEAKFLISSASSGERELLTYLFAIYALNVRDALIVIDEPELHLHPRWQSTLLALFERLSRETHNQFLLATHSPVFVSPASIQYVSRVFSKDQRSDIVRLNSDALPDPKHLFSIVNSQNNERMFFADKVVLVEGISDRLFFDAVFQKLGINENSTRTCEILSVGGKNFFKPYEAILKTCQVPYAIVADFDYLNELGTSEIRKLFGVEDKDVREKVIDDPQSKDGSALVARLDDAISTGNTADLKSLWEYIKSRRSRLRNELKSDEQAMVDEFIAEMGRQSVFVLAKGDLETYLPEGYRSKDLEKVIQLIGMDFWPMLPEFARDELTKIGDGIRAL